MRDQHRSQRHLQSAAWHQQAAELERNRAALFNARGD